MTCPHNKPSPSTFTVIATKDGETYRYGYCRGPGEGNDIGKTFMQEGYTDIKMEWHRILENRKVILLFCMECKRFHLS